MPCDNCWPVDGSKPDFVLYYNSDWFVNTILAEKGPENNVATYEVPVVVLGSTDPNVGQAGLITISEFLTPSTYIDTYSILLKDGAISFIDEERTNDGSSLWGPNQVLPFKILTGTKNFLFAKGYVVVVTDENNGRQLQFYFAK
jgi:hypothetical protein